MISIDKFKTVVENTPLISIDFIIENQEGKFLLGKRVNEPAKDFWFTLGGRIFKNESLDDAVERLSHKEFNHTLTREMLQFHGIYEHFYDNSFADSAISTHYIVLAYRFRIEDELTLPTAEHTHYRFFSVEELLDDAFVHTYVKNYFKGKL